MNKRTVKEILVGLVLGALFGGILLASVFFTQDIGYAIFVNIILNGPVTLISYLVGVNHTFYIYFLLTILYFVFWGIILTGLIASRRAKALLFMIMLLVIFHLFAYYSIAGLIGGNLV